jgi:hypothetical protein
MKFLLALLTISLTGTLNTSIAQQSFDDFLPLAVGNRWTYDYYATDWWTQEDVTWSDSGTATYTVLSKLPTLDSIVWTFQEVRSVLHHVRYNWLPVSDTSYPFSDSTLFSLTENTTADHRLLSDVVDWASVFYLTPRLADSTSFLRYYPSQAQDTFTVCHAHYALGYVTDALTVTYKRGVGLFKVSYAAPLNIGDAPRTNHALKSVFLTSVDKQDSNHSFSFTLEQNYPNPFNPATNIRFHVKAATTVTIKIYDALGRLIVTLLDHMIPPGAHSLVWQPTNQPSGVYFCVARARNESKCIKLALLK